ncbi:MAG: TM2 domain-containing protein [Clostridiales bacterium]|jgi:TM2 domain-containing membrane protein YozV|nr:TM2 domain-containing protein [Clostridiales bacterium]
MAKIVVIDKAKVVVGLDDGATLELARDDVRFEPFVGQDVEIFQDGEKTYIAPKNEAVAAQMTPQREKRPVNKVAYVLLALFLGGIGAHKFYQGKIGLGILYLLFCWTYIPGIVALIEFIIALTKTSDANGNILM